MFIPLRAFLLTVLCSGLSLPADFAMKEARFAMLARSKPADSERLLGPGQQDILARWSFYEQLANVERGADVTAAAGDNGGGDGKDKAQTGKEISQ